MGYSGEGEEEEVFVVHAGEGEEGAEAWLPDSTCVFCGYSDPSLTPEKLDLHFWKDCPMLTACKACGQIVEVSNMDEHLLTECEHAAKYTGCDVCGLSVPKQALSTHHKNTRICRPLTHGHARCPLCHVDFPEDEEHWRQHLMSKGPGRCAKHTRGYTGISRPQVHGPASTVGITPQIRQR
eukprot:GCRY01007032.1.p1 GENE.GCRY01007032.1~~GCRY01007032.1.p1  ORF type:complete len:181 (+),score=40.95 GCRY01007032.1:511-1053(+)